MLSYSIQSIIHVKFFHKFLYFFIFLRITRKSNSPTFTICLKDNFHV